MRVSPISKGVFKTGVGATRTCTRVSLMSAGEFKTCATPVLNELETCFTNVLDRHESVSKTCVVPTRTCMRVSLVSAGSSKTCTEHVLYGYEMANPSD